MPAPSAVRAWSALLGLAYLTLAWAVRFDTPFGAKMASLAYPLDTFSMYSDLPGPIQTALVLRGADGAFRPLPARTGWACDLPPPDRWPCAQAWRGVRHKTREQLEAMQHVDRVDASRAVELVARTWRIRPWTPPQELETCVIAHCQAAP